MTNEDFQRAAHTTLSRVLGIARMSEDEMRAFVLAWCDGKVFSDQHVMQRAPHQWEQNMTMVFMPIAFGVCANWTVETVSQLGIVYEYMNKAMPRAINGMPCFMSMHVMHKDDWARCREAIIREEQRRQEMML